MDRNFEITIGDDGYPRQSFNGKLYKLYPGHRYFSKHNTRMHSIVWEFYNGKQPKGYHVHHINENTWDNRIENLELIEAKKHLSEHAKQRFIDNPEWAKEFHQKGIESAKEWHKSEEGLQWHREHAKKFNFGTQEYGQSICEFCQKEYTKKNISQRFCHNNCKASDRRKRGVDNETRVCKCGKEFTINRYSGKENCSRECFGK